MKLSKLVLKKLEGKEWADQDMAEATGTSNNEVIFIHDLTHALSEIEKEYKLVEKEK